MINLSFDELRLIAQRRNISDYENKSKEDLIKALSEPKPETPKLKTPKLETPKPKSKPKLKTPKPKPKLEIRVSKRKLKELRKDFDELRHDFDKKEMHRYRKAFCLAKNKKYLSESQMNETKIFFNELKKV